MKLTTLQTARKKARSLFILSTLLLLLSANVHAQDTLFFEDFNREVGSTGCPTEIDFEPYIHFYEEPYYYDDISCSDTALTRNSYRNSDLFFSVSIDSSKINFGDIMKFSFDVTSLEENGAPIITPFGPASYIYEMKGDFGHTNYFPEKYRDSIITNAQISVELEISLENDFSDTPNFFKMIFGMYGNGYVLDNFLITTSLITGINKDENEDNKILFYYTLEGRVVEKPEQGQFVIAMHENGERRKLIFNNK